MKKTNGFSLIEIITVIGIMGVVAATGFMTFRGIKDDIILEQTKTTLVWALEEARNRAATGFGQNKQGVHIEENKIVIFEGDEYVDGEGEEIIFPPTISTDQTNGNIIFNRISASVNTAATIIINNIKGSTKIINITSDGKIIAQ
ncbi:MAG: hypothetical protein Athens071424_12 [Parcubacteria group bacterium Athens0714_24]|nr:MAG: hypothetical protein Athens071424_12 [Parcubacteria group bacterium Athens0714_24]